MNKGRGALCCFWLLLLLWGCNQVEYTRDGVPIAPFGSAYADGSGASVGDAQLDFSLECWLNFMPGPRPDSTLAPLGVALSVAVVQPDRAAPAIHCAALTLWSESGDSMLVSLPLVNTHTGPADVRVSTAGTTELTVDPRFPRRGVVEPGTRCAPRLVIQRGDRLQIVRLPTITVQAVY